MATYFVDLVSGNDANAGTSFATRKKTVASAITAFIAVKWLLRYIQTHRFTVFAWYRFVLGAALLLMVP